uniref:Uncharacterized protein n=1 Tax=Mycena chlorophos TaxID=658473 RepID=A0ABQ0LCS2_MYCCL|nr:predicted protein [Mycena chlorophos]
MWGTEGACEPQDGWEGERSRRGDRWTMKPTCRRLSSRLAHLVAYEVRMASRFIGCGERRRPSSVHPHLQSSGRRTRRPHARGAALGIRNPRWLNQVQGPYWPIPSSTSRRVLGAIRHVASSLAALATSCSG